MLTNRHQYTFTSIRYRYTFEAVMRESLIFTSAVKNSVHVSQCYILLKILKKTHY